MTWPPMVRPFWWIKPWFLWDAFYIIIPIMITCWASGLYECSVQLSRNDYEMNNFTSWQKRRVFSIFPVFLAPSLLGCTLRGSLSPSPQARVIIHITVKEELWAKVQDQNDTDEHHLASHLESFQVYFSLDCSCPAYVVHPATQHFLFSGDHL